MAESSQVNGKPKKPSYLVYLKAEGIYLGAGKGYKVGFEDGPALFACIRGFSITLIRVFMEILNLDRRYA